MDLFMDLSMEGISKEWHIWTKADQDRKTNSVFLLSKKVNLRRKSNWDALWDGLFPAAAKSLQSCPTLRPHRQQPTRLPHPWDSPGKNTGVGCHVLLQCMKVKSEREVAQSCPTLRDPMDCSPPGSSVHGIFQARVLEWGAIASLKKAKSQDSHLH